MKALVAAIVAGFLSLGAAEAQTLAQPGVNGNAATVMCVTVNSTLSVNGVALGSTAKCFAPPDATAIAFVGYAIAHCPPVDNGNGTNRACTPTEALAWYGANMEASIYADVQNWAAQQAAAAAVAAAALPAPSPAN